MASEDQLFDDRELFAGDPLNPDLDQVCPESILASLTSDERRQRMTALIAQSHEIIDQAWKLAGGRMRAAWAVLFSGGNDSTVLAHLMRHRVDFAVHLDTTIGVPQTRQFVHDTCRQWGLDLVVRRAPVSYRDLVCGRWQGFPGPAHHQTTYQRLKERPLDEVRSDIVTDRRRQRVLLIAGRRRSESRRRATVPLYELDGSAIWCSPIAMWAAGDLVVYRQMHDVPFNPVTDHLGMSGECLCGAYAQPGELDRLRLWYPQVAAEIDALQVDAVAAGIPEPFCRWGHGQGKPSGVGRMCSSCDVNQMGLFEEVPSA